MLKYVALTVTIVCLIAQSAVAQQAATATQQQRPDMGSQLMEGLKATPGCLAVDSCRWQSGRQSIVAWFKNKEAVVDWYHSKTHQAVISGNTDGDIENDEPLQHVTDENQPIFVIATLTPSNKPELPGFNMSIKQISIELFAPLPGGAHVNGRLSPSSFVVPHMRDYSPPKEEGEDDK